jgi:hypothetical protein
MQLDDEPEVRISRNKGVSRERAGSPVRDELDRYCPVCGGEVVQEKCKVVCRSESCLHRVIYTCSEF